MCIRDSIYTDKDIAKVVALAKKARLTWKGAGGGRPAVKATTKAVRAPRVTVKATPEAKAAATEMPAAEKTPPARKTAAVKRTPTTRAPKVAPRKAPEVAPE